MRLPRLALALTALAAAVAAQAPAARAIALAVDARHAAQHYLAVRERLAAAPGPLTLAYPKWIPGEHRPDGPIAGLSGLVIMANGARVGWRRDPINAFLFRLDVPTGAHQIEVRFDYLEPALAPGQLTGGAASTPNLAIVNWNQVVLYPLGAPADRIFYRPRLRLPAGWRYGTALPVGHEAGGEVVFRRVALNRLVDSPLIAGAYFRAYDITPRGEPIHHELDIVADAPADLALSPRLQRGMTELVVQAGRLFGARHYRDYHFLLTLSDFVPHFGVEHHESDDARLPARTLLGPRAGFALGSLLAHEYVHSWNGKFRRPAGMAAPPYQAPHRTSMLWAYEGITNFLGYELAARSGLWSDAQYRRAVAGVAASLGPGRPGRQWRSLADTGSALHAENGVPGWLDWTRSAADFHVEGVLLWLDAAMIIARQTHGAKSFDDFCRLFYGGPNRGPELRPYSFEQLTAALNRIAPYDWARFLRQRVDEPSTHPPLGGLEASGWRLVYTAQPPKRAAGNALYSLGLQVGRGGAITDAFWGMPAFRAGLAAHMRLVGVNGAGYTRARLEGAIAAAAHSPAPIRVQAVNDGVRAAFSIPYHGGLRYPHLVRNPTLPDYLDRVLLRPRERGH
jgi:predicted metalloprotease with PDZ domain